MKNLLILLVFFVLSPVVNASSEGGVDVSPLVKAIESIYSPSAGGVDIPEKVKKDLGKFLLENHISVPKVYSHRLVASPSLSGHFTFVIDFAEPSRGATLEFSIEVARIDDSGWLVLGK